MIYLNEVKEGGTTEFPNLNKIFSPSEGKALIWNNLNEDGTLTRYYASAHPVIRGNKTIITKWFRQASLGIAKKEELNKHIKTFTKKGFKK